MEKIREHDIVTVQIQVTGVEDYSEEGQQVRGRMLPNGENVGWLIPQEAKITLHTARYRVGDTVEWGGAMNPTRGTVKAIMTDEKDEQRTALWIKPDDTPAMQTHYVGNVRRILP